MGVSLVLIQKNGQQREIPLTKPVQVLGRQTDCAVRIAAGAVSRRHCEVAISDGIPSVKDLGSSNGTHVNGKRITQIDLAAGDVLTVGDVVFVVRINGKPEQIDSEDALDEGAVMNDEAAPSPGAPTRAITRPPEAKPTPGGKASGPSKKPLSDSSDESSVSDFDFLDEDDDIKDQPKL